MTILEDLWYGNINPHETFLIQNRQFKHLLSLIGKNRDKLSVTLTEQQKEALEKYDDAINEMHSLAELTAFKYGFSLGVRLMTESLSIQTATEDLMVKRGFGSAFFIRFLVSCEESII